MLIRNHHRDRSNTVGMNRKQLLEKKKGVPCGNLDDY